MQLAWLIFVGLHGLIHLLGFVKAFELARIDSLSKPIGRPTGLLWLLATGLFGALLIMYAGSVPGWKMIGVAAVVLSQVLVLMHWHDARYATLANVIIALGLIFI
ncbi:MAG: hypothetical protein MUF24_14720 [Chitinophagaceae bacterium]|nr:hypothetical protein [Chitinophagaceae bacterium]